jgi:hypothetical protein
MFPENVTPPELAFISSQEKPDPRLMAGAEISMGLLHTRIALLCTIPSSVVLTLNSTTGRFHSGSFPESHGHRAFNVWRNKVLLVCATQNVSLSDAGAAAGARSMVKPSRRFA